MASNEGDRISAWSLEPSNFVMLCPIRIGKIGLHKTSNVRKIKPIKKNERQWWRKSANSSPIICRSLPVYIWRPREAWGRLEQSAQRDVASYSVQLHSGYQPSLTP